MPGSRRMPVGVEAHVRPERFNDGDPITLEVTGATHLASKIVNVILMEFNAVETHWILQAPMELDERGNGTLDRPDGLNLGHEASVYVNGLMEVGENQILPAQRTQAHNFYNVHVSIANPTTPITSLHDVAEAHRRIAAEQESVYAGPLGDPATPGAVEHRVLSVVQNLYMITSLKLPGIEVRPLEKRPRAAEEREIVNATLTEMGWASRIPESTWHSRSQGHNPLTLIVCNQVWAQTYEQAGEIARDARDRIIALLAINRRAIGRPVCLVIEQRQPDNTVVSKWAHEEPQYTGNLGGPEGSGQGTY